MSQAKTQAVVARIVKSNQNEERRTYSLANRIFSGSTRFTYSRSGSSVR